LHNICGHSGSQVIISHYFYTNVGELRAVAQSTFSSTEWRTGPCNTWLGVAFRYLVPGTGVVSSTPHGIQYLGAFKDSSPSQTYKIMLQPTFASGSFSWAADPALTIYNQFYYLDYTGQLQYPPTSSSSCTQVANFCTRGVMSAFLQIMSGPINPVPLVNLNLYKYFNVPLKISDTLVTGNNIVSAIFSYGLRMRHNTNYTFPGLISFPNTNGVNMVRPCIQIKLALNTDIYKYRSQSVEYRFRLLSGSTVFLDNFKVNLTYKGSWSAGSFTIEFSNTLDGSSKSTNVWPTDSDTNKPQTPTVLLNLLSSRPISQPTTKSTLAQKVR
jgi:hypothetical protein